MVAGFLGRNRKPGIKQFGYLEGTWKMLAKSWHSRAKTALKHPKSMKIQKKKALDLQGLFIESVAERGGFEPPSGYYPEHAFQACYFFTTNLDTAIVSE